MNVTPETVLNLLRRVLELKGVDLTKNYIADSQRGYRTRAVEVGEIRIVEWMGGDITVQYVRGLAYAFDYRKQPDRIILVNPDAQRYLDDIVAQVAEILPLDALAAIE